MNAFEIMLRLGCQAVLKVLSLAIPLASLWVVLKVLVMDCSVLLALWESNTQLLKPRVVTQTTEKPNFIN